MEKYTFGVLYSEYYDEVNGYFLRNFDEKDAEDLTQELFLAFEKMDESNELYDEVNVKRYLYRFAIEMTRVKKTRERRTSFQEMIKETSISDVEQTILLYDTQQSMWDIINNFPQKYQDILKLQIEEFNSAEISKALGISRRTLKKRLNYIRKILKRELILD